MAQQIQVRRDSAADWTSAAPTLADGEIGFETDTGKFKIGNGSDAWADLDYFDPNAGVAVDSVNAQTGAVVLDADDIDDSATTNKFATAAQLSKLDGVEAGATADQSAAEILTAIKTVDGTGSGLDADTVDGSEASALLDRANHTGTQAQSTVTNLVSDLAAKAPLASPALTGNPTAPTQTAGDNSTKIATTAYVDSASGTSLTVKDEGTPLATAAASINFVGAGVTASGTGADKTITIPAGVDLTTAQTIAGVKTFTDTVVAPGAGASDSMRLGKNSAAAGTSGTAVGAFATASGASSAAFGYDAQATQSAASAFGRASRATGTSGVVAFGYAATASGDKSTAIGNSAFARAGSSTAIGQGVDIPGTETSATAIGQGATITMGASGGGEQVVIGQGATVAEWRATAIGYRARATAISSTAIGRRAAATATHAIALGRGAWANAANTIAIGFSGTDAATDVYFESGHTHKYVDEDTNTLTRNPSLTPIVIHGFDAYDATGSPTNNVAGGPLRLAAGRGTGTAAGGSVSLQVAPAGGSSNNTKNTLVNVVEAGVSGTATTLGFFGATPVVKPTGVAVTAGGIHAALVSLGLIAA